MLWSVFSCFLCVRSFAGAFAPSPSWRSAFVGSQSTRQNFVALTNSLDGANNDLLSSSFLLSQEEIKPIITFGKGDKEKQVNAWGLWCFVVTAITTPVWAAALSLLDLMYLVNDEWDPHRAVYDAAGKTWVKSWLSLCMSVPTFSGDVTYLKEGSGPCLYVANHASWMDIPILSTMLDPVFKFIAKGELRSVPCIGKQLVGGRHILIDRNDRRSQLKTFKDAISWLKKGVPVMAFPEGKRSRDGRLMEFKGGLFSMASKTKVPIVPITVSHAHAVMPCNSLFPVQSGNGKLHVHVHEPIQTVGRTEDELVKLVWDAFSSSLPYEQRPKIKDATESIDFDATEGAVAASHHVSLQHLESVPHFLELKLANGASLDPQSTQLNEKVAAQK